ncbi:fimbrillin family protein [Bacteroides bouchesdurhonensis]|uniref:fimbrillin family protein n=1 Tax=Bacteroides bouchesdurhonensis TaxID=1841855 RepID=UPI0011DD626E|nr:fimbrillin family protein [Bacteroides bouchesdurhonensis]
MKTHHWVIGCLLMATSACSSGEEEHVKDQEKPADPIPITLNCGITASSRATDYGYENQDKIGLYVVNYKGNAPGTLQSTGNHVDNIGFTYNGTWEPDVDIYWKDDKTKADFYCYFPYGTPSDLTSYAFSIKEDQSTEQAYKDSEFLYGKTSGVAPTEKAVVITTNHIFSCAVVTVQPGNGFTTESLAKANVSIKINNIRTGASIDLIKGTATATGIGKTITPLKTGDSYSYKALIVPQTISADNFITVYVDGRDFNLKKEITFVGGRRYSIPVTVSKTSYGINVNIGAWEDDEIDNGGTAE